jgi:hypothetical protein
MSKIFIVCIISIISLYLCTICPDKSYCDGTCCQTPKGRTTCCSIQNAVCCEDGMHCCKPQFKCNAQTQKCDDVLSDRHEFLLLLESDKSELTQTQQPLSNIIVDVVKCIQDVKPVSIDIELIIQDYKNGNEEALQQALLQLSVDGYKLGTDCYKVIHEILK